MLGQRDPDNYSGGSPSSFIISPMQVYSNSNQGKLVSHVVVAVLLAALYSRLTSVAILECLCVHP